MGDIPQSDPAYQQIVHARAPSREGGLVRFIANPDTLRSIARLKNGQNDKLGQFVGLVHGNAWAKTSELDHFDEGTPGLTKPVAIFAGLKRARNGHSRDTDTLIYVTNPGRNYAYPTSHEFTRGPVRRPVPEIGNVFVTYVDYSLSAVDEVRKLVSYTVPSNVVGVVSDWDWLPGSLEDPRLPIRFDSRYEKKLWDEHDA